MEGNERANYSTEMFDYLFCIHENVCSDKLLECIASVKVTFA
jgi:hypothetical protein